MARRILSYFIASLFSLMLWLVAAAPAHADSGAVYQVYLPLIAQGTTSNPQDNQPSGPTLESFAASVTDGAADVIRGVFVSDVLALKVEQQPADNPGYVSAQQDTATQFGLASAYGVTGLLAHNFMAGVTFFDLAEGQDVWIVLGDGALKHYRVERIERYQALQPYNPYSDFVDLATGEQLSASALFMRVYTGGDQVTFQTCITLNGNPSGGRLFVIATPAP
jgi:hypothetical protein